MTSSPSRLQARLVPIAASQAVGFACGVAGVKIATKLVSPADYGAYGVFLTFTPLGMWVVHAGLIKFVLRHWAGSPDRHGLLREVAHAAARKLVWLALATIAAAFTLSASGRLALWPWLFASSALLSIGTLAQSALQAERAHWADFTVSAGGSLTRTFVPPLLYFATGGAFMALTAGFCVHALTLALLGGWCLRHSLKTGAPTAPAAPQLTRVYEGPLFVLLAIAGWATTALNRWIVAGFFGEARAGYFTLAGNIALIVTGMLGVVFIQYFQPGFFAVASEEPDARGRLARRVDQVAALYTAIALAGVVALRFGAPLLMGSLIGEKYRAALGMIGGAGCFGVAIVVAQFYQSLLLAGRRENGCAPVDLANAGVYALAGAAVAALGGETGFLRWLLLAPLVPWLIGRSLARHYYFRPAAAGASAPVR